MRIAFDYQIFGWQKYGGVSRYLCELARELATTYKQDVNIVAPLYVNQYLKIVKDEISVWGMPIASIPKTGRVVRAANSLLVKPLLKYLHPDIVHETYYSKVTSAPKNAKVIITVHDMIHERLPWSFSSEDPIRQEKALAVKRADHVICVSRHTQRDLIELLDISPAKTSVIHLGFSLTTDQVIESSATNGKSYLLYVGHRGGYKNFERLLKSVATSSILKSDFCIVCFGGGAMTSQEKALISELGFTERDVIHLSGSDALLAGLYKNAMAFVYPSLYEGFGIPPLEAMSFDCPVACSNSSSIPEVVGNAGIYFDPNDIEDMRNTIEKLVTNDTLRKQLISAGRERIKMYSWRQCASKTLDIYRKVLTY